MKLPVPFVRLPLQFDAAVLAQEIDALGKDAWIPHPEGFPGNSALPLIAANGDALSNSIVGPMRPTAALQACPYLYQALAEIGAVWGRSRLMRLSGQAEVTEHVDINYYWRDRMRVHVPIRTRPSVRFICGEAELHMAPGQCWIFDTWRRHRVVNAADDERIHLVADTVGGERFWEHVDQGLPHGAQAPAWRARDVVPQNALPPLQLESINVPTVMTPWEIRDHLSFLLGEAAAHPQLAGAHKICGRFVREWQALWAAYGDAREAWPKYRSRLDAFSADLREYANRMMLRNEAVFINSVMLMVVKVALSDKQVPASGDEYRQSLTPTTEADAQAAAPAQPESVPMPGPRTETSRDALFDRPVFIISPPRSGSTLLFETLARVAAVHTIGSESHGIFEGMPALSVGANNFESNRLTAQMAVPAVAERLRQRFRQALIQRDGAAPGAFPLRMLEKTPKNALRIPFLTTVFPEAQFVYLHRDPRQVIASMIEAWKSGRFVTYPKLPEWAGPPWSLLLVPGWRELAGLPLHEIVARQWQTTVELMLDDLQSLPVQRCRVVGYDALVGDPAAQIARLCAELDLQQTAPVESTLPPSRHTLSAPAEGKWKRHEEAIASVMPGLAATIARLQQFVQR